MILALLTGLSAGAYHVLAGPDHLAAVAPLAASSRVQTWRLGLRWGAGHAGGVALVGLAALFVREWVAVENLSGVSERLVGVLLIALGLWGLRQAWKKRLHGHRHDHDGRRHWHVHLHGQADRHHVHDENTPHQHTHTALAVGTLHGLAGGSHFLAVLPAMAFRSTAEAMAYLLAYGLGTATTMAGFAAVIGWTFQGAARRSALLYRRGMAACSVATLMTGAYWLLI